MAAKEKQKREQKKPKKLKAHAAQKLVPPVDFLQSIVRKGWHLRGTA